MLKFLRKTHVYILAVPLLLTYLGAASNQLVLIANHDTFPVMVNSSKAAKYSDPSAAPGMLDDTHCIMTDKTHLNLLADVIDLKGDGINSIGDLMLETGTWMWSIAPFLWGFAVIGALLRRE